MKITFLELRRDPKKLLEAIERRDEVVLSRRGCEVARVVPIDQVQQTLPVTSHAAFGIWADQDGLADPSEWVQKIRRGRFHDF